MNRFSVFSMLTILLCIFLVSCTKEEVFPPEPAITFLSFTKKTTPNGIDEKGVLENIFH